MLAEKTPLERTLRSWVNQWGSTISGEEKDAPEDKRTDEDWEAFLRQQNATNDALCSENGRLRAEIERLRAEERAGREAPCGDAPSDLSDTPEKIFDDRLLCAVLEAVGDVLEEWRGRCPEDADCEVGRLGEAAPVPADEPAPAVEPAPEPAPASQAEPAPAAELATPCGEDVEGADHEAAAKVSEQTGASEPLLGGDDGTPPARQSSAAEHFRMDEDDEDEYEDEYFAQSPLVEVSQRPDGILGAGEEAAECGLPACPPLPVGDASGAEVERGALQGEVLPGQEALPSEATPGPADEACGTEGSRSASGESPEVPSGLPSGVPSGEPFGEPSGSASGEPSREPSRELSEEPFEEPSGEPLGKLFSLPSAATGDTWPAISKTRVCQWHSTVWIFSGDDFEAMASFFSLAFPAAGTPRRGTENHLTANAQASPYSSSGPLSPSPQPLEDVRSC